MIHWTAVPHPGFPVQGHILSTLEMLLPILFLCVCCAWLHPLDNQHKSCDIASLTHCHLCCLPESNGNSNVMMFAISACSSPSRFRENKIKLASDNPTVISSQQATHKRKVFSHSSSLISVASVVVSMVLLNIVNLAEQELHAMGQQLPLAADMQHTKGEHRMPEQMKNWELNDFCPQRESTSCCSYVIMLINYQELLFVQVQFTPLWVASSLL